MNPAWDHIVVGAGSAGCVLAARLSEDSDRRVLLIEAGGADRSPLIHIPGFLANVVFSRSLNWAYEGEPDASLDGRRLTWMAGRVLGGSSSINGMIYGRGLPEDYRRWVAAGAAGWDWEDLLPWFRKSESWTGPAGPTRGVDGPLAVRLFEDTHPACRSVMEAFIAAGLPRVADYSAGVSQGIGLTQATQNGGWRASAASAYLKPARHRGNLRILTGARATGLVFEGERCVGIRYARRGVVGVARAAREITLAAGAIGSPKLLLLSGVGPADALRAVDTPVRHDRPGVGQGLNDHVNVKLSASVRLRTYNSDRVGVRKAVHGVRFLADRAGPAASPANHVQGFVKSAPDLVSADYQVQVMALGFNEDAHDRTDGVSVVVSPCHPKARGRVGLRSSDPRDPPRIDMNMLESEDDVGVLLRGCRHARDMLERGPVRDFGGEVFLPPLSGDGDVEWKAFFRRTAGLNWHPTSTCRMGEDADAVVDPQLRVRGLAGLSIADASVMPCVTSGNTNAPVIAIAERAAAMIAARTA